MGGKRGAIEADHGLGHERRVPGQLEHRVGNAATHPGEIDIRALTRKISRSALIAKMTPQHQPAPLHGSDLDEPAEILPAEHRMVVGYGAQRTLRLITHPGSFSESCGDRAR